MLEKEKQNLYEANIEKHGKEFQIGMLQEEATELAQASLNYALACRKLLRKGASPELLQQLATEIADVEITTEQMKIILPKLNELVQIEKDFKLNRLKENIS